MEYGKMINGVMVKAGRVITAHGREYHNPPEKIIRELGYLPIEDSEPPKIPDKSFSPAWAVKDDKIVKVWSETPYEIATPDPIMSRIERLEKLFKEHIAQSKQEVAK